MNQEYAEFIGVDSVHAAVVTEDTIDNYSTETPEYFAPTAEIAGEPETEVTPTYYDNVQMDSYISEGATTLTLTLSGVPAKKAAKYLGKDYDETTGRVLDDGDPNPPDCALSFRYNRGKNGYRYYQYLKGKFTGGSEEAATKTNTVDVKTYQMTFTAVLTQKKWTVNGKLKPLKRIYGDTIDSAFNADGWFNEVQTPDTVSAPSELTMSSLPLDNATGVAIGANIVFTFNNKISTYNTTMVKSDFTPVAAAISFDATGKILTVNPNADLTAASSYAVILTNVKDVYGQALSDTVVNFTTA